MYRKPLLTACFILAIVSFSKSARDVPPRITSKFPKEVAYKEYERAELACEAQGHPAPSFEWKKDGELLSVTGHRVRWAQPSSGTIAIDEPTSLDEGIYQCFARNAWGTAVGGKTLFKKAVLEPFPSVKQPKLHYPTIGSKFTLQCTPPMSYPQGLIYWGENKPNSRLKPIENTDRVSLDYSGNLHFTNIQPEDSRSGYSYACILENPTLRSLVQGDDQIISPVNATAVEPRYANPTLMWSSSTSPIAIWGETMKMKCIFAGYPTPQVRWERRSGHLSSSAQFTSLGQELLIRNVQFDDEGSYRCLANNSDSGSPVFQDFQLTVESMPYWREGQEPEDVSVAEDEPAEVSCLAYGKPKPSISWFINGLPVEELPEDARRTVTDQSISYSSVTKVDKQVIQCNASNAHGYILANPYINVVAEPPSFIATPKSVVKVAEGENVTLTCRVFGAPKPVISWNYLRTHGSDTQPITPGGKFLQQNTGDLLLKDLLKSDSGLYVCAASNKFGNDRVTSEVLVRERTVITEGPRNRVVNASTAVVFPCDARTDPLESSNLVIEWHKNGKKIDFLHHPHMEHSAANNSLVIVGAEVIDSANYSCVAKNGMDESVATAQLFVHGLPDPPIDVRLVNGCHGNRAELKWLPGNDNNNRIIEFVVYGNTSYDPPNRFRDVIHVPESLHSTTLTLQPWTTYSFHVTARNSVGESRRSRFTSEDVECSTPPAAPFRHPEGVCSVSRGEDELVVVWQPMEPADHNGEHFRYVVGYRLRGDEDKSEFKELSIDDWRSSEAVIPKQPTFREYMIYVKAANSKGEAPSSNLTKKVGYSGQGLPLISPEKFALVAVNSTSAEFSWSAIREDPNEVKGFFLGYMIKFWKTGDPGNFRKENLTLRSFDSCPAQSKDRRRRMTDGSLGNKDLVTGRTDNLWPNSVITAVVMVMNGAGREGPTSNSIEFQTPEGVPDAVTKFEVLERGSNHFLVSWAPPKESNGNLTGYLIEFEEAPSGVVLNRVKVNSAARKKKITGLKNDTSYIFKIRATTSTGSGQEIVLHEKTRPSSVPSKPGIADVKVGHNFVVVRFDSSTDGDDSANPGSIHCVEYRLHGDSAWRRSDNITNGATVNVTGLDEGAAYELRVVAFNDNERHSTSDVTVITTGQKADTANGVVNETHLKLIAVAAVLFLVVFIVCLFCYISYSKAGIYPVNKEEKKHGCAAGRNDEPEFGEYVRPSEPLMTKSTSSISSLNEKKSPEHIESDNDSLAEYADPDPSKFNEDGSFIGKYGKKTPTNAKDAPIVSFSTLI